MRRARRGARRGGSQGNRDNENKPQYKQPMERSFPSSSSEQGGLEQFRVPRKAVDEGPTTETAVSEFQEFVGDPRTSSDVEVKFPDPVWKAAKRVEDLRLTPKNLSKVDSKPGKEERMEIIRRPNFGTKGRQIALVSNYFLLQGKGNDVYHYDIEITPKSASGNKRPGITIKQEKESGATCVEIQQNRNFGKKRCREIINQFIEENELINFYPFYDGHKNLYTFRQLRISEKRSVDVVVTDENRTKTYKVTIQPVAKSGSRNVINLDAIRMICEGRDIEIPHEAVMAFETLLCHRDSQFQQVAVGRSFFFCTEMRKDPLDGEIELWKGYNQSVNLTQRGPAVVINAATKAFHRAGFVIEHACDILGFDITTTTLTPKDIEKLSNSLSGVKVEVTHLPYPKKYTVASVSKIPGKDLIVDIRGEKMTVAQFFAQKYKRLKFPNLPCLEMKNSNLPRLEMKTCRIPTYTPMELCVILPGQPKQGKLDGTQTREMISRTAVPPSERFEAIQNYANIITEVSGPYVKFSGFKMETTPLDLNGRVISPPALSYKNKLEVQPNYKGTWRIDGQKFSESLGNAHWALVSFGRQHPCPYKTLAQLSSVIIKASAAVGLYLNQPSLIKPYDRRTTTYDALSEAKSHNVDFVFAVLSRVDDCHSYDELKFIADIKLGLITQCMEEKVVSRCFQGSSTQIINNVISKLNIKLGGINHTFLGEPAIPMKRTMVMGADAAHSPRESNCPSIAAVVGNVDDVPFQYAVACRIQKNTDESKKVQEIILDMKEMTKHILNSYRKKNRVYPERIIFFRDGVSEGQFTTVLEQELKAIQSACHELMKKFLPVTFIVVQKRHQTRFRPKYPRDGIQPTGNVPPGTTVDTDVVHPFYFDYFLCSHEGIKGTSRPAHYVVLHDDNKFPADELQQFCYDLCHVYARCNRSISIPAPVMNAHLAAARAKKYVDLHLPRDSGRSSGSGKKSLPQEVLDSVNNISTIEAPMFFV